jgi:hypothetical protein
LHCFVTVATTATEEEAALSTNSSNTDTSHNEVPQSGRRDPWQLLSEQKLAKLTACLS